MPPPATAGFGAGQNAETQAPRGVGRRRWSIGVLLGVGILINYFDRVNISVAAPQLQQEFGLTPAEVGLLFSAFFWSYAILQAPVGMVLDRFGVMTVSRVGAFLWGVASGVIVLATGFYTIFGARVLLGVAEAPAFPAKLQGDRLLVPAQRAFAGDRHIPLAQPQGVGTDDRLCRLRLLMGAVAPAVTGLLVGESSSFASAFLVAGIVLLVGIFFYVVVLGRIEPIPEPDYA